MGRPLGSKAAGLPSCSRPGHDESRVVLNGHYGKGGQRQRFRCFPTNGDKAHTFVGQFARRVVEHEMTCASCEQHLAPHQGPAVAPRYDFDVASIATALELVGRGLSYTEVAQRSRARTRRGNHISSQMVGNWVEVFTPVVAERHAVTQWPETIVIDATPYNANLPDGQFGRAFSVVAVYGYNQGAANGSCLQIVPLTSVNKVQLTEVLSRKSGVPELVVTDEDPVTVPAVAGLWPSTSIRLCRWHLYRNLRAKIQEAGMVWGSTHPLALAAATALKTDADLIAFERQVAKSSTIAIKDWVADYGPQLHADFAATHLAPVWSNGAVEQVLLEVKRVIGHRAFCLRNAARTASMLELVRLAYNKVDDATVYAADIRLFLERGGTLSRQLTIADRKGMPSLRP